MTPPMYEGDLRLRTLVREVAAAWDDNPTSNRVWRALRPWTIATIVLLLIRNSQPVLFAFMFMDISNIDIELYSFMTGPFINLMLGGVLSLVLLGNFGYPAWAYRRAWVRDDMLRLVDQTPRQRFIGMMAPLIRVGCLVTFVTTISSLLAHALTSVVPGRIMSNPSMATPIRGAAMAAQLTVGPLFTGVMACLIICTLALRLSTASASPAGRKVFPYWKSILGWIAMVFVFQISDIPIRWLSSFSFRYQYDELFRIRVHEWIASSPFAGIPLDVLLDCYFVVATLYSLGMSLLILWIAYKGLLWLWRRDIPIAREFLFRADDDALPVSTKSYAQSDSKPSVHQT